MKLQVLFCLEASVMITDGRRSRSLFTLLNRSRSVHSLAQPFTQTLTIGTLPLFGSYLVVERVRACVSDGGGRALSSENNASHENVQCTSVNGRVRKSTSRCLVKRSTGVEICMEAPASEIHEARTTPRDDAFRFLALSLHANILEVKSSKEREWDSKFRIKSLTPR
ncbi:uncharacterized [Tachysurus ichikawai]